MAGFRYRFDQGDDFWKKKNSSTCWTPTHRVGCNEGEKVHLKLFLNVFLHLRLFIKIFLFWKQVGIRPFPTPWLRQHTISFPRVEVNDTLKPSHRWTNGPWPLKTIETNGWKTPKPLKNHWNQWSGGWKSFNGDGWVTPKPSKNNWKQWSVGWKTLNGNG